MSERGRDLIRWLQSTPSDITERGVPYFLRRAWADNTLRAYRADLKHFADWTGLEYPFPTSVELILRYLRDHAECLAPSTLAHRVAALSFAHRLLECPDPTGAPTVRSLLAGIRRYRAQDTAWSPRRARAFTLEQLRALGRSGLEVHPLRDARDRALVLLGFFGAFREGELRRLTLERCKPAAFGLTISVGPSKTDQTGDANGHKAIPRGPEGFCPVHALRAWCEHAAIEAGPLFRRIDRHGYIGERPLSHVASNQIVRRRARLAGVPGAADYSFHSLRASFVTIARGLNAQDWQIMRQSHHRDARTLNLYDRPEDAAEGNAIWTIYEAVAGGG